MKYTSLTAFPPQTGEPGANAGLGAAAGRRATEGREGGTGAGLHQQAAAVPGHHCCLGAVQHCAGPESSSGVLQGGL